MKGLQKTIFLLCSSVFANSTFAQTLQTVTNSGATTTNVITVGGLISNSASLISSALPTNISGLNGLRLNGSTPSMSFNGITYASGGGGGAAISFSRGGSWETAIDFYTNSTPTAGGILPRMRIATNGFVGIGTISPQSIFHVQGGVSDKDRGGTQFNPQAMVIEGKSGGRSSTAGAELEFVIPANTDGTNEWGQGRIITVAGTTATGDATGKMIIGTRRMFDKNGTGHQWYYGDDIVIDGLGNIGIGTLLPAEKLSVKCKIRAQEIKVEASGWPDFVFAKGYQLPSLQATEKHILAKGHLPGIPSAAEVAKDGIELGEMNKKLLQKIEELTLHLIEQDKKFTKQIEIQQKQINALKNKSL